MRKIYARIWTILDVWNANMFRKTSNTFATMHVLRLRPRGTNSNFCSIFKKILIADVCIYLAYCERICLFRTLRPSVRKRYCYCRTCRCPFPPESGQAPHMGLIRMLNTISLCLGYTSVELLYVYSTGGLCTNPSIFWTDFYLYFFLKTCHGYDWLLCFWSAFKVNRCQASLILEDKLYLHYTYSNPIEVQYDIK